MAERSPVKRRVVGSSPTEAAIYRRCPVDWGSGKSASLTRLGIKAVVAVLALLTIATVQDGRLASRLDSESRRGWFNPNSCIQSRSISTSTLRSISTSISTLILRSRSPMTSTSSIGKYANRQSDLTLHQVVEGAIPSFPVGGHERYLGHLLSILLFHTPVAQLVEAAVSKIV
jgi:hypothetical protein